MKYIIEKLNNGVTLAYHSMKNMESVALGVWVRTGSRYEKDDLGGISHYLEHLTFRGSRNLTANQIRQSIEGVGGTLNAFTSQEYTCYFVKLRKIFLDLAFKVLSDIVLYPNLNSDDVEKERKIIVEEIKMNLDIPARHVYDLLDSILWRNHPLGRMIIGTITTVESLSRKDIENYKNRYYNLNNLVIVACGSVEREKLKSLIDKYFSITSSGKKCKFTPFNIKQTRPNIKFQERTTQQTHIALGSRALYRDHPQNGVLSVLNVIMGANMSSRLFNEIREKRGLAYEIGSRIARFKDTGAFITYAGIEHRNLLKVIEVMLEQLDRIRKNNPTEDEVNRAKEYYKGQLLLMLEKTMENMLWFGEHIVTDSKITNPNQLLQAIDRVKPDEISRLANEILKPDNLNLSIIGPNLSNKQKKLVNMLERF